MGNSGAVASDQQRGLCVVDALSKFILIEVPSGQILQRLPTGKRVKRLARQGVFAENSNHIICGSDHGIAYVFGRESGMQIGRLNHGKPLIIQHLHVGNLQVNVPIMLMLLARPLLWTTSRQW